jgi:uncharacterized membrane protein YozB (DUF420 family)
MQMNKNELFCHHQTSNYNTITITIIKKSWKQKKMILHTCEPISGFLCSYRWREKMILHTCGPTNGFLKFRWVKKMILHICKLTITFLKFTYIDFKKPNHESIFN